MGGSIGGAGSSIFQSAAGLTTAQSAILGDSQGSVGPIPPGGQKPLRRDDIPNEDLVADGGVGSELGESYVDSNAKTHGIEDDDDEGVDEGGVLGLLAQIYGANGPQGRAGVM